VLPLLIVAVIFLWGGIALAGVGLIALAVMIVVLDAWANRPVRRPAPRYREDY
jgi:Na+/H+-translocating membrane pyrophosphatase